MSEPYDVVVVGAGLIGLATVHEVLHRAPGHRVLLLDPAERNGVSGDAPELAGASAHAGAVDSPLAWSPVHEALVRQSWAWHERFGAGEHRGPFPIAWHAASDEAAATTRDWLLDDPQPLADDQAAVLGLATGDGQWLRGTAYGVDPRRFAAALRQRIGERAALRRGVLASVAAHADGLELGLSDGTVTSCRQAVLAVGPWLPGLPGVPGAWARGRSVRAKRVFGLRVRFAEGRAPACALASLADAAFVFPARDGDEWVVSVKHDEWDVAPVGCPAPPEVYAAASRFLAARVGPDGWSVVRESVFADTFTPDSTPVVDWVEPYPGRLLAVTGTHGSGVRLAPGLAMAAVDRLLGGAPRAEAS